jgi:hypothetical protein
MTKITGRPLPDLVTTGLDPVVHAAAALTRERRDSSPAKLALVSIAA